MKKSISIFINDDVKTFQRTRDSSSKRRKLDEEDLGSEDDEERPQLDNDDMDGSGNDETHERAQTILDLSIGRHATPKPSDGEV